MQVHANAFNWVHCLHLVDIPKKSFGLTLSASAAYYVGAMGHTNVPNVASCKFFPSPQKADGLSYVLATGELEESGEK